MKTVKVTFNGYSVNKTEPKRQNLYNNEHLAHRENEVINEAYKAANSIYPAHSFEDLMYGRDDFSQDAAVYILEKFKTGYFDGSKENLFPIIYRLINGYFVYNKKRELQKCATFGNSLNTVAYITRSGYHVEYLDFVGHEEHPPEDLIHGDACIVKIIQKLDPTPYTTRKHEYTCEIGGKVYKLNEALVGALIVDGKDLHDILDIFNCSTSWSGGSSKSAYIAKIVNRTKNKILEEVKELSVDSKESIVELLSANSIITTF